MMNNEHGRSTEKVMTMGIKKPTAKDTPVEETTPQTETIRKPIEKAEKPTDQVETETVATTTEPESTEVAAAPRTEVAAASQGNFKDRMAEKGYGGLELGFGSFPTIRLMNEGVFEDDDENEIGTSFSCLVQSTRIKHLYKQAGNQEGDVYYSYDEVNLVKASDSGSATVEQLQQEFKEDGWELECKSYLEAVVLMKDEDADYDGEMFLLSIPPASRNKFAGLVASLELKGKNLKETVILCTVGKKRKAKRGNSSYFPWNFKAA